jgi:histidinol-phosphate phosphatase family protein
VFLDRDGTLIEHVHHLTDPADVRLIKGAARAVRGPRAAGYAVVLVTNQSVIGRSLLTAGGLTRIHGVLHRHLKERGTRPDCVYFCPIAPTQGGTTVIEHPDRKPGSGMLRRAAEDLHIDLVPFPVRQFRARKRLP